VTLYRLSSEASVLVNKELASGARCAYELADYQRYLDPCDDRVELDEFDAAVDEIIAETRMFDASVDQLAAPRIHRALGISRRLAADPGVWRFLAVIRRPQFVRHRWENRSWATTRTRYWRPGTRPDSNAFSRLWWIAELTCEGSNYDLTSQILSRQPLATAIFVRQFSSYRPATEAFVSIMEFAPPDEIESVARHFNALLSTVVLESQDKEELEEWLRRIRKEIGSAGD
jgi:hypothetical protein